MNCISFQKKRKKQKQIKQGNGRIIEKKVKMFPR